MRTQQNKSNGFTLMELMIVVAIISIIAAIGYPSYQNSVAKARRGDAQGALQGLAQAMERHFTANNSYEGAASGGGDTGAPGIFPTQVPIDGSTKFYDLTIESADDDSYTLRATPINGHVGDGILELDSTSAKRWDSNDSGSFDAGESSWNQ